MRLQQVTSGGATKLAYDGLDRIAEYDSGNALLRRYVHGPGADEPIVWYEGSGTSDRRFLSADERGSIIAVTDGSGALLGINRYDEFGQPQATNLGAFGYTGQAWLPSIGEWYYKARVYDPELGRFLQTNPIGYEDSPNLYAYVLNDPVNNVDPLGLSLLRSGVVSLGSLPKIDGGGGGGCDMCEIVVTGQALWEWGWGITSYSGLGRVTGSYAFAAPEQGGGGGSGTSAPQPSPPSPPPSSPDSKPNPKPTKKKSEERSKANQICRGAVTGVAVGLFGRAVLRDTMHTWDFAKAAGKGAGWGSRFGLAGAGTGAVLLFGGAIAWDIGHEQLFTWVCGD